MRRRTILIFISIVVIILIIAAATKPDDKTIKIEVVKAIWGRRVPTMNTPQYYNQFMDLTTKNIDIDDWIFLKRIEFTVKDTTSTIGFAAFGKVMLHK